MRGPGPREHSQAEHGLHGDEQGRHVEGLEEHLRRLLPVLTRVERRFRKKNRMLQETAGLRAGAKAMCRPRRDLSREPPAREHTNLPSPIPPEGTGTSSASSESNKDPAPPGIFYLAAASCADPHPHNAGQRGGRDPHNAGRRGGRDPYPHNTGQRGGRDPHPHNAGQRGGKDPHPHNAGQRGGRDPHPHNAGRQGLHARQEPEKVWKPDADAAGGAGRGRRGPTSSEKVCSWSLE